MTLLVTALVVFLLVALAIVVLQRISTDATLTQVGTIVFIIIGVVVVASRAGVL